MIFQPAGGLINNLRSEVEKEVVGQPAGKGRLARGINSQGRDNRASGNKKTGTRGRFCRGRYGKLALLEETMAKGKLENNNGISSSDGRVLKLLLVDENVYDLEYYAEVLRYLGYTVKPVDSYRRAASALGREQFDAVIVDQGSVDFEGRSVLSRAVEVDRHVPVLVLTRTVDADCCVKALDAGAREYVQKPLTISEVRELVGDYVALPPEALHAGRPFAYDASLAGVSGAGVGGGSLRKVS